MTSQKARQIDNSSSVPFIKQFSCSICSKSFSDAKAIMNHIKKGHKSEGSDGFGQSLIFGYGFWNVGYGYKCRGYPDFGFGFRFWKIGEFYENLGP